MNGNDPEYHLILHRKEGSAENGNPTWFIHEFGLTFEGPTQEALQEQFSTFAGLLAAYKRERGAEVFQKMLDRRYISYTVKRASEIDQTYQELEPLLV